MTQLCWNRHWIPTNHPTC